MSDPKRHHWWPQLQSGYWCAADGCINVVGKGGLEFRTQPINVGLEKHLYSQIGPDDRLDAEIERWLATEVDGPFDAVFSTIFDMARLRSEPPRRYSPEQKKAAVQSGFRLDSRLEYLPLSGSHKLTIAKYVAALVVRNPQYLAKISAFHSAENYVIDERALKNITLQNMLEVYRHYLEVIRTAEMMLIVRDCDNEFIFSDHGVVAGEPWRNNIPFDLHVPLTPDMSLQVLPVPDPVFSDRILVEKVSNKLVSRYNRISLSYARRFVYTRSAPPEAFIRKYFSKPASAPFGFRYVDGEFETRFDPSRDY